MEARLTQFLLAPRSKPQEITFGIGIAYTLTAIGMLAVNLIGGDGGAFLRMIMMMIFLTLAPLISFAGLAAAGSVAFTGVALLIYLGLWVFAVQKLSGMVLRVASVILVSSWMVFGIWASTQVY